MRRARWGVFVLLLVGVAAGTSTSGDPPPGPLDFRSVIREAKARVFPAVVFVKVIRESRETGRRETEEVTGSGVIVTPGGELVTNWHVVDKAVEVRCLLSDGRGRHATVVGADKDTDVALARLVPEAGDGAFPWAALGDSEALVEGDVVMAMGAPWGMGRSVSLGIVSCTRRYIPGDSEYSLWLQTDAAISPGNSGGPLVNTTGEIVGLNARAMLMGGDMGFAIPAATVALVVGHLRQDGRVVRSWTGLQLQPLRDFERDMVFPGDDGVIVAGTDPGSPAREAGILAQDRLLAVGDTPLLARVEEDLPAVRHRVAMLPRNQPVAFRLRRGTEERVVHVVPGEKGSVEGEELDCPRWDFSVKELNRFETPELFFHRSEGVFVHGVRAPGNALNAGLMRGDILLKIGLEAVVTLDDVRRLHAQALRDVAQVHRLVLTILRNGLLRQVVLDFARDYERK